MKARLLTIILSLFLFAVAPWLPDRPLHAAPGDFLFQWGKGHLLTLPTDVALDSEGNAYTLQSVPPKVVVLDKNGKFLRKWGSWGSGPGQFKSPASVAISGNLVFVSDPRNFRIEVFDRSGNFIRSWGGSGSGNGQFQYLGAISCDSSGNVYAIDSGNRRIQVFDAGGNFLLAFGTPGSGEGQFRSLVDVAVDTDGNIYVLENDRVQLFDKGGGFQRSWGISDGGYIATDIAVDTAGSVYISGYRSFGADARMRVYDSMGNLQREWGGTGHAPGEFEGMSGAAIDAAGNVHVVDIYNARVQVFDPMGNFLRKLGGVDANGQFNSPNSVATDAAGNVYVADSENHRVQVFDGQGRFLRKFGSSGAANGQFDYPFAIAVDEAGRIYVTDNARGYLRTDSRIQVFDNDGRFLKAFPAPSWPKGIAVDRNGNLYLTDSTDHVTVMDGDGNIIRSWGSDTMPNLLRSIAGIALDSSGNVHVANSGYSSVVIFDANGDFIRNWGGGDGPIWRPGWIAFDRRGNTYVSDHESLTEVRVMGLSQGAVLGKWLGYRVGPYGSPPAVAAGQENVYVVDSANNRIRAYAGYMPYEPRYSLGGTVRKGCSTGPVLAGATVSVAGATATTSSTGAFLIGGIPAGSHTVVVSKPGYVTKILTGFVLKGDKSDAVFYLKPVPTYTLSGTVRKGSGTGAVLAGAVVSIAGKSATTGSTGTFCIKGIPAGSYTITISKSGYATKKITGYAISCNKSGVVFSLARTYYLSGVVRAGSNSGPALAGAVVSIAGRSATSDSTGTFSISDIPAGTYTLTVSREGYLTRTIKGYVVSCNRSGKVLYLAAAPL